MTITMVKNKIASLEAQIILLKKAVKPRLDLDIDETNWRKVKKTIKNSRAKIYKKAYG